QQVILTPEPRHPRAGQRADHARLVATDDVQRLAVRRQQNRVTTVFAAAVDLVQELRLLEGVAVVLGAHAMQTAARPHAVDADPGALYLLRYGVEQLDFEVFLHLESFRRRRGRAFVFGILGPRRRDANAQGEHGAPEQRQQGDTHKYSPEEATLLRLRKCLG